MENGPASFSALTSAAARAAHLIVDKQPYIFADTLASALLGDQADELTGYHRAHGTHVVLARARAQVACRSRYTERRLADLAGRGIGQYVLLGAGLDSFAYRSSLAGRLRVFEVDHPATLDFKRRALDAAGIAVPAQVRFVPADLAADDLGGRLADAGFDSGAPALVAWLGVAMYLTRQAIARTAGVIGRWAPGTELIGDYLLTDEMSDEAGREYAAQVAASSAGRGEPWLSRFAPEQMSGLLRGQGFGRVRQVSQRDAIPAGYWRRGDSLRPAGLFMLAHASVGGD